RSSARYSPAGAAAGQVRHVFVVADVVPGLARPGVVLVVGCWGTGRVRRADQPAPVRTTPSGAAISGWSSPARKTEPVTQTRSSGPAAARAASQAAVAVGWTVAVVPGAARR